MRIICSLVAAGLLAGTAGGRVAPAPAERQPIVPACFEVDVAFADGVTTFRGFALEAQARTWMRRVGMEGAFVDRQACTEPLPQCTITRYYPAAQVTTIDMTRLDCS